MEAILKQLDDVISAGMNFHKEGGAMMEISQVSTRLNAAILRLTSQESSYRRQACYIWDNFLNQEAAIEPLIGLLKGLREDISAGYVETLEELIRANLFSDFMEMAEHLNEQGYKDPAAVIAGSVLEEHLRKLAQSKRIATEANGKPVKAETLNAEIMKAKIYEKLDNKNVTAWLDLRNKAAHGHYEKYTEAEVNLMMAGIRLFLSKHPA